MKYLNALVIRIRNIYIILSVNGNTARDPELAVFLPSLAQRKQKFFFLIKYLDIIKYRVRYINMAKGINCGSFWPRKRT